MADPRTLARRLERNSRCRTCKRYLANGLRCTNPTDHADGWCRADGCPGYTTPAPDPARFGSSRPHYSTPVNPEPCPLDSYDITTLGVTRNAVDAFLKAHEGFTRAQAESSIKTMIEDFAAMRRWSRSAEGWLSLAHMGYYATVAPDLVDVVAYGTSHAERTWGQVKAGVPSRGKAERRKRYLRRKVERRRAVLTAAGATITTEAEAEGWFSVITGPDGRSVRFEQVSLRSLSAAKWRKMLRQANAELDLGIPLPEAPLSENTAEDDE
ncbi:hypothetical protein [Nocardiopsis algeriensis]|uniref:Uncharacterized protein n=1 Tax=Nocardiopsis algeriensis TaxID=1478215 RepID=A0A841ITI7_9ACTN|nr:hypothetical protein [Nocardiopsis algeriensis]MBB6119498.1 hypothetical protein [Nocardiopsis algeriensis]